jgi:hypothetical protein
VTSWSADCEEPSDSPQSEDRPGGVANRGHHGCQTAQTRQKAQVSKGPREALADQPGNTDTADPDTARDLVAPAEPSSTACSTVQSSVAASGSDA